LEKLREPAIKFSFVKMGTLAGTDENPVEPNKFYLDVGNSLQRGVLDHHQDSIFMSASEVVYKRPELVLENVETRAGEMEIVLHTNPDLDAIVAAYLTKYIIEYSVLPQGVKELVDYVSLVDQGAKALDPEHIRTPFTAITFLYDEISRNNITCEVRNRAILKTIFPLIETLLNNIVAGCEIDGENSLDWNSEPLCSLIPKIERDRDLYFNDLLDPEKIYKTEIVSILLPSKDMTRWNYADGVFINDPASALFTYYARSDKKNSPQKDGFVLTLVHNTRKNQTIIATDATKDYSLPFLGSILEFKETLIRSRLPGGDTRLRDKKGELKKKRPGYHNPDPWYDGKGHNYTITGSPREGTLIPPEKIRRIVATYTVREV